MTVREEANILNDYIGLNDWQIVIDRDGYRILKEDADHKYKLRIDCKLNTVRRNKVEMANVIENKSVQHILDPFFPEFKRNHTWKIIIKDLHFPDTIPNKERLKINITFEDCLPIWRRQYHEKIIPLTKSHQDLEVVHATDAAAGWPNHFMGQPNIQKRLVLKRLLSKDLYKAYKIWLYNHYERALSEDPEEKYTDRFNKSEKLIKFLDDLDVETYLRTKPWRDTALSSQQATASDPIITDQSAMLCISGEMSLDALSDYLGGGRLVSPMAITAGEASRLSLGQRAMIDVLQLKPAVIVFVPDYRLLETIDLVRLSQAQAVARFIIDLETSDTIQLDYYDQGRARYRYLRSDSELVYKNCDPDLPYATMDVEEVIRQLFLAVSGRAVKDILESESVTRYQLTHLS